MIAKGDDDVSKLVEDLVLTLTKETEIYKILLGMAEEKKQVIIDGRVKDLEKMTAKEQGYVQSLMKLERLREHIVEDILKESGLGPVETVTELIQHLKLDDLSKGKIVREKNQLMSVIDDLKDKNDLNGQLITQSLKFIDFNMSVMGGVEEDNKYNKDNADRKVIQKKSLFDVKV